MDSGEHQVRLKKATHPFQVGDVLTDLIDLSCSRQARLIARLFGSILIRIYV